jgi:hypothetical protein
MDKEQLNKYIVGLERIRDISLESGIRNEASDINLKKYM